MITGKSRCLVLSESAFAYTVKTRYVRGFFERYIEERAVDIANYIIEQNATVRQTAKEFRVSKSTVHMGVTK